VVSLTETALPSAWLDAAGLTAVHLPVRDFTAPSLAQIREAVAAIGAARAAGEPVAVHCAGGKGRTGTMLACSFVAQGMGAKEAIAAVRAARPGSVETRGQARRIAEYAASLHRFPYATYDATVDAAYVYFRHAAFERTEWVDDRRNVDYGPDGQPNGVEFLYIGSGVSLHGLPHPEMIAVALAARGIGIRTPS